MALDGQIIIGIVALLLMFIVALLPVHSYIDALEACAPGGGSRTWRSDHEPEIGHSPFTLHGLRYPS